MMSTELIPIGNNAEIVNKRAYGQHSDNTRPVSFLSEVEVNAMAAAAKTMRDGDRNELMILVTFQLALRISETLELTKRHRVFMNGKARLAIIGKGNKPRVIAMPEF